MKQTKQYNICTLISWKDIRGPSSKSLMADLDSAAAPRDARFCGRITCALGSSSNSLSDNIPALKSYAKYLVEPHLFIILS